MRKYHFFALALAFLVAVGAGCEDGAQRGGAGALSTRDIALAHPRPLAEVAAQVPDGALLVALDIEPMPGQRLSLRLADPTRDPERVADQYVKALKPHVAEARRLLSSGSSEDPEEAAATAQEIIKLDSLLELPATPESLLIVRVRLRGKTAAIDAFSDYFSKPDGDAP